YSTYRRQLLLAQIAEQDGAFPGGTGGEGGGGDPPRIVVLPGEVNRNTQTPTDADGDNDGDRVARDGGFGRFQDRGGRGADSGRFDRTVAVATRDLAAASQKYGIQASRFYLTPWERAADLQTGAVPAELVDLAHQLGAGKTEDGAIRSIRNYLVDNFQYSLDTSAGGPYHDAVSDFLFASKKGFCVQFASAFVILARLNGIPARYVTGFLAELPNGADQMTVTGLSAHSWAETWDSHRGWVTQEATPPMIAAASGNTNVLREFNPTDSSATQRQLEAVLGGRLSPGAPGGSSASKTLSRDLSEIGRGLPGVPLLVLIATALLAVVALLVRFSVRRFAPVELRLRQIVRRIERRSQSRGFPDPSKQGWKEWSFELSRRSPGKAQVARRAATLIHRSFFSGRRREEDRVKRDVVFLNRLYRALPRRRKRDVQVPPPRERASSRS
ncbi:MAG TPA: transglutaminase-like domain-containing protein, partial [Spirochaetia bacterium]|nr:transglutaminase-like domain-containing protein [Spirochaetia bacterium]